MLFVSIDDGNCVGFEVDELGFCFARVSGHWFRSNRYNGITVILGTTFSLSAISHMNFNCKS